MGLDSVGKLARPRIYVYLAMMEYSEKGNTKREYPSWGKCPIWGVFNALGANEVILKVYQ